MPDVDEEGDVVDDGVGNTQVEPSQEPPELVHIAEGLGVDDGGVYCTVGEGV